MKTIIAIFSFVLLAGCSATLPSFSDPNQSARATDIRFAVAQLDCAQPHKPQIVVIEQHILWFQLYSESKGARQQDVLKLIKPLQDTVTDFHRRTTAEQGTETYCRLKKSIMQTQAERAAKAILGRY